VPYTHTETTMHIKIRSSSTKHKKKTGYRTRQNTKGGRKTNRRQRKRHGSF
jgi:ribosomal protein L34